MADGTILFDRQKRLLGLLHALGGTVGNLDFQKLLLLYCSEQDGVAPYEFVPYKFGGFSFTSYADRRKLIARGLLLDDDRVWQLSPAGHKVAARIRIDAEQAARFALEHRHLRGDALVAETYRRLPYWATQSEIADRVLQGDEASLDMINRARPPRVQRTLFTIGYEGRTLEAYLNELLRAGVTVLCDVRRNPISRKYGFSKKTLANSCEGLGIRYMHLPELGIASDRRSALRTDADYSALFAEYARSTLPIQTEALMQIRDLVAGGEAVALTCYERTADRCHRHCVAVALRETGDAVLVARHL